MSGHSGMRCSSLLLAAFLLCGCVEAVRSTVDLTKAEYNMTMKNYNAAIPYFETYLKENPEAAETRSRLGFAFLKTGRLEEAIKEFERVLRQRPGEPLAVLYLGMAYVNRGEYARAAAIWQGYRDRTRPLVEAEVKRQITLLLIVESQRAAKEALAREAGLGAPVAPAAAGAEYYEVQAGDTLSHIALQTGVSVSELKRLNAIEGSLIRVGQQLLVRPGEAVPAPGPAAAGTAANTIAVCYYKDLSPDRRLRAFQKALAAMVITDLSRISSLRVVERLRVQALLREMKLGQTGIVDPETAPRVGRLLGAETLVIGSLSPGSILSATSLASTTQQTIRGSGTAAVSESDFYELPKAVVRNVVQVLKIRLTPAEEEAIRLPQTRVYDAFIYYGMALDALDEGKWENAKDLFAQAVKRDPDFLLAREGYEACPGASTASMAQLSSMTSSQLADMIGKAVASAEGDQAGADAEASAEGVGGGGGGGGGPGCFTHDTLILMADSSARRIVDLRVGDWVMSLDTDSGTRVARRVVEKYHADQDHWFLVNGELRVTGTHPFYTAGGRWKPVAELGTGESLMILDGRLPIRSVRRSGEGQRVYNLRVEDHHNYFVSVFGENFYLVHNK